MIDSHCHLDHEPMYSDLKNVINRSKNIGVEKILSICTTISSFEKIKKIVNFDPIIYGTFGIHPHECADNQVTKEDIISNIKQKGLNYDNLISYFHDFQTFCFDLTSDSVLKGEFKFKFN